MTWNATEFARMRASQRAVNTSKVERYSAFDVAMTLRMRGDQLSTNAQLGRPDGLLEPESDSES